MNDTQTTSKARVEEKHSRFTLTDWYQQHAEPFQMAGEEALEGLGCLQDLLGGSLWITRAVTVCDLWAITANLTGCHRDR